LDYSSHTLAVFLSTKFSHQHCPLVYLFLP